jgi:hypothetical protein
VSHFFHEAANRVGVMELSNRAGISPNTLTAILMGRNKYVRKETLRKVMLELISMRRKKEHSISKYAAWRIRKRANGSADTCQGCHTALSNYTEGCEICWERKYRRGLRSALGGPKLLGGANRTLGGGKHPVGLIVTRRG